MRLCPTEQAFSVNPTMQTFSIQGTSPTCSTPASIARALLAIGNVTRGVIVAINIVGGADVGWLAAVSEWLFGLKVQIYNVEGEVLYSLKSLVNEDSIANITITYHSADGGSLSDMVLLDSTYRLEDARKLFESRGMADLERMSRVCGPVKWEEALSQTFGSEFQNLMRQPIVIGTAFGCAARIMESIAQNEDGLYETVWRREDGLDKWWRHGNSCYGIGFVHRIMDTFLELSGLATDMERASRLNLHDAKASYETQISQV